MKFPARVLTAVLLISCCAAIPAIGNERERRIVAVGDIHGAFAEFTRILQETGLIDEQSHWSGGDTIFVQTGDFLDRGLGETAIMDLMNRLEKEAPRSGGKVVVLLGNHEIMNLTRDLRYVSASAYEEFVDRDSEERREKAYSDYTRFLKRQAKKQDKRPPEFDNAFRKAWMQEHPAGLLERAEELSTGRYGKWLRRHGVVTRQCRALFVHGGIHPRLGQLSVEAINKRVGKELQEYAKLRDALVKLDVILPFFDSSEAHEAANAELAWLTKEGGDESRIEVLKQFMGTASWFIKHPDGPVWFRGYARWEENAENALQVAELKKAFDVDSLVVGHTTVLKAGIQSRFGGQIFLIDTGMLPTHYEGGQASALELHGAEIKAIYLDGREALLNRTAETGGQPR